MSRPPFSSVPTTAPTAPPAAPARPSPAFTTRTIARDPSERRTLVVGRGISLQGIVQDAERLVVEGTVEATMIHATELAIAPGGVFKGEVEVEDAEIAGTIDGTLTARGSLIIRVSGKVLGTARCRRLQVEDGGQITGRVEMIVDQPQGEPPVRQVADSAFGFSRNGTPATPASTTPVSATPTSAAPASATPASATPASAIPVGAAPVSA